MREKCGVEKCAVEILPKVGVRITVAILDVIPLGGGLAPS